MKCDYCNNESDHIVDFCGKSACESCIKKYENISNKKVNIVDGMAVSSKEESRQTGSTAKKYKLICDLNILDVAFQLIVWIVLTVVSFGLLAPFFIYYFLKIIINHTEIHVTEYS